MTQTLSQNNMANELLVQVDLPDGTTWVGFVDPADWDNDVADLHVVLRGTPDGAWHVGLWCASAEQASLSRFASAWANREQTFEVAPIRIRDDEPSAWWDLVRANVRQAARVDPWQDSAELIRRRVKGEPIPPVPPTSLLDMPPSEPTC